MRDSDDIAMLFSYGKVFTFIVTEKNGAREPHFSMPVSLLNL